MRRVKIKTWVPWDAAIPHIPAHWSDDFASEGLFHCWGIDYEELGNGNVTYSVGIVELEDGSIVRALPESILFIKCETIEYGL